MSAANTTSSGIRETHTRTALSTADLASAARGREVLPDEEPVAVYGDDRRDDQRDDQRDDRTSLAAEQEFAEQDRRNEDLEFSDDEDFAEEDEVIPGSTRPNEALVALFTPDVAEKYRSRWTSVQSSFVDDPRQAVRSGDELVAEIMTNLANSFADERHRVEGQLDETGEGSTENLRLALRRYRSFFERLLSL